MQTRPIVLVGLALAAAAGCQSYFPNGYGGAGPYSAFPQGGYGPPPGSVAPPTTYQQRTPPAGQITGENPPIKSNLTPSNGQKNVPDYREPAGTPSTLGTPNNDDGEESIRRNSSSLEKPPARLGGLNDESEETLSAFGEENFEAPRRIESAGAIDNGDDIPRTAKKQRPNPYKYDERGYTWLRGTVSRDRAGSWHLRYSNSSPENTDDYGGVLQLVGNDKIDTLIEDEVVFVKGRLDDAVTDSNGKPSYRVESMKFLRPIED